MATVENIFPKVGNDPLFNSEINNFALLAYHLEQVEHLQVLLLMEVFKHLQMDYQVLYGLDRVYLMEGVL